MRKEMLLAIVCVLLLVSTTAADPGDTLWTRTYGGWAVSGPVRKADTRWRVYYCRFYEEFRCG